MLPKPGPLGEYFERVERVRTIKRQLLASKEPAKDEGHSE